jgi:hypothetical protein
MIRALISMNNEMESLKSEIIKVVDEKTKMEMLKEIVRYQLKPRKWI